VFRRARRDPEASDRVLVVDRLVVEDDEQGERTRRAEGRLRLEHALVGPSEGGHDGPAGIVLAVDGQRDRELVLREIGGRFIEPDRGSRIRLRVGEDLYLEFTQDEVAVAGPPRT